VVEARHRTTRTLAVNAGLQSQPGTAALMSPSG
jgi:hypothetical protein